MYRIVSLVIARSAATWRSYVFRKNGRKKEMIFEIATPPAGARNDKTIILPHNDRDLYEVSQGQNFVF